MKIAAFGTQLEYENPASTWNVVGQVRGDLAPAGDTVNLIDVTTHDSPNGRMEYVGGLKDAQEKSFQLVYDPADTHHSYLEANIGGTVSFRITMVDTGDTVFAFSAVIMGFEYEGTHDGAYMATVTLKRTGANTKT